MKDKKDDRRVKYSKMVIKESFIQLLSKKDISKITIKEICEQADVNRATFYAHYSDQYDLMRKIEDELFDNIRTYLSVQELPIGGGSDAGRMITADMVEKILDYVKENAPLCRLLLNESGDLHFQKRIMTLAYSKNIDNITNQGKITQEEAEYIYSFGITGCIGFIQNWFEHDMDLPTRRVAEMLVRLLYSLADGFLIRGRYETVQTARQNGKNRL